MDRTELEAFVESYFAGPSLDVSERMRYVAAGFDIHNPAPMPCLLPAHEWRADSFIAVKGRQVEISLIAAVEPGKGAWRRLMARLRNADYRVTIVEPLGSFAAHLARNGFSGPHIIGSTFADRMTVYRDTFDEDTNAR